jgi:hypothetical protein
LVWLSYVSVLSVRLVTVCSSRHLEVCISSAQLQNSARVLRLILGNLYIAALLGLTEQHMFTMFSLQTTSVSKFQFQLMVCINVIANSMQANQMHFKIQNSAAVTPSHVDSIHCNQCQLGVSLNILCHQPQCATCPVFRVRPYHSKVSCEVIVAQFQQLTTIDGRRSTGVLHTE